MNDWPRISILVAARNEEENIGECLMALSALDYPREALEILIGNDASSDRTEAIIAQFIENRPHFKLFNIPPPTGQAKGKAHVLAVLAGRATGRLFLVTDADVRVPSAWAKAMVGGWRPEIGIMTGFTLVKGASAMANLQAIDWALMLSLIKMATDLGIPPTAMGNNMLVSREAYWHTGGYEAIPFSVTEDFALFQAIHEKGWKATLLISKEVMAFTKEAPTWKGLLYQRKRWMRGALQAPWYLRLPLFTLPLWMPFIVALAFWKLPLALGLWAARFLIKSAALTWRLGRLGQWNPLLYLPLHELYDAFLMLVLPVFYVLPIAVQWKGRRYA